LERTDNLENSKGILAASNNFELFIAENLRSAYGEAGSSFSNYLKPYMVSIAMFFMFMTSTLV
jgi:hypothetical protein